MRVWEKPARPGRALLSRTRAPRAGPVLAGAVDGAHGDGEPVRSLAQVPVESRAGGTASVHCSLSSRLGCQAA